MACITIVFLKALLLDSSCNLSFSDIAGELTWERIEPKKKDYLIFAESSNILASDCTVLMLLFVLTNCNPVAKNFF